VRPLLPFENRHTCTLLEVGCRTGGDTCGQVLALRPKEDGSRETLPVKEFRLDGVFPPTATQSDVFDGCNVRSMVAAVCKGYK
jgi:hypothetical protein